MLHEALGGEEKGKGEGEEEDLTYLKVYKKMR